jgi:replicative DNA helicase
MNQQPHSKEAEKAYLGSLIINPESIRSTDILPEDFYAVRNRQIFECIKYIFARDKALDILTLSNDLQTKGQLEEIGGQLYLAELIESSPNSMNVEHYASIIKDKAQRRRLLGFANELAQRAYDEEIKVNDTVSSIAAGIVNLARPEGGAVPISVFASQLYDDVLKRSENPKEIYGIQTEIKSWDKVTNGNQKGEETLIAARPNVGKTIFLTQMAVGMAKHEPGVFYEMEMGNLAVIRRIASWLSKIPTHAMKSGYMEKYTESFATAIENIDQLNIYMSDSTSWDTASLRADLARLKSKGIGWFCLDYLLLLNDDVGLSRNERIENISRRLHGICVDLDLSGIIIHTLNKAGYGEELDLQHLSGPAAASYDADNVVFMTSEKDSNIVEFTWGKTRDAEKKGYMKMVKMDGIPAFGEYIGLQK